MIDACRGRVYTERVRTYAEALTVLTSLIDYERSPAPGNVAGFWNLDRVRDALARVGDPHLRLRIAHIAGTKGKGSTAAMLAAILRTAGRRVGLFTKPHLLSFCERIRCDDQLIPEEDFAALVEELQSVIAASRDCGDPLTFFETVVILAFLWFTRQAVDIVVLETGLGGRLDATNVAAPVVTGLTTIALDHLVELGKTLEQVAAEKAGIIKPGVPVVCAPHTPEVAAVIAATARALGSPLVCVGKDLQILPNGSTPDAAQVFTVRGRLASYVDLHCPLLGAHQQVNAAVAIGMAECLGEMGEPVTPAAIRRGLELVDWPGRLQLLRELPAVLLDGAHDPIAVTALLAALDRHYPDRRRHFIIGFAGDKDWRQMLRQLLPTAASMTLTTADSPRAAPVASLLAEATFCGVTAIVAPDVATALQHRQLVASPQDLICVTGSFAIVGDALRWWKSVVY